MPKPKTNSSRRRWELLSNGRRFALAKSVIRRRGWKWRRQFAGLIAVGFGIRHQSQKTKRDLSPGILFFVSRKRDTPASKALPMIVRAKLANSKRSVMVSIPTDVIERRRVEFQADFEARDQNGTPLKVGNACCTLAAAPTAKASFIMGCHHVFLASEDTVGLVPQDVSYVSYGGIRIGEVAAAGNMNPAVHPEIHSDDAALVYVEESGRQALEGYWDRWFPSNIARSAIAIEPEGQYALYADKNFLDANYIGWVPDWPVPVGSGRSILIPEALLYNSTSVPGMSGAAFINKENGVVLGMHMARMESPDVQQGWVAVAQPMWHLASKNGPFGMDLYLAKIQ